MQLPAGAIIPDTFPRDRRVPHEITFPPERVHGIYRPLLNGKIILDTLGILEPKLRRKLELSSATLELFERTNLKVILPSVARLIGSRYNGTPQDYWLDVESARSALPTNLTGCLGEIGVIGKIRHKAPIRIGWLLDPKLREAIVAETELATHCLGARIDSPPPGLVLTTVFAPEYVDGIVDGLIKINREDVPVELGPPETYTIPLSNS